MFFPFNWGKSCPLCNIIIRIHSAQRSPKSLEQNMHPEQIKIYQKMSSEKKLQIALELYYSAQALKEAELKRKHPGWSQEKIQEKVKAIFLHART